MCWPPSEDARARLGEQLLEVRLGFLGRPGWRRCSWSLLSAVDRPEDLVYSPYWRLNTASPLSERVSHGLSRGVFSIQQKNFTGSAAVHREP